MGSITVGGYSAVRVDGMAGHESVWGRHEKYIQVHVRRVWQCKVTRSLTKLPTKQVGQRQWRRVMADRLLSGGGSRRMWIWVWILMWKVVGRWWKSMDVFVHFVQVLHAVASSKLATNFRQIARKWLGVDSKLKQSWEVPSRHGREEGMQAGGVGDGIEWWLGKCSQSEEWEAQKRRENAVHDVYK